MKNKINQNIISQRCKTKYPLVLIHGAGFKDDSRVYNYWGRIPDVLKSHGAAVYCSGHNACCSIEESANDIKPKIIEVISLTGTNKVNIIAHSKGGFDARYMISMLDMERYVASLTTLSTPHHGLKTVDKFHAYNPFISCLLSILIFIYYKLYSECKPNFFTVLRKFTTDFCKDFNARIKDSSNVYYQSYAAKMKNPFSDLLYMISYKIIKSIEGDNDGLCSVESSMWGNFMGVLSGKKRAGISHTDEVDQRTLNGKSFDMPMIYVDIVEKLKEKGF